MSQDVICGGHVEEQIRENPTLQIRETLEFQSAIAGGNFYVAILAAIECVRRQRLQKVDHSRNAYAQLLDRLFIVFERRCFYTGETSDTQHRGITRNLHLL